MPFLEGLSAPVVIGIVSTLGVPGLVVVLLFFHTTAGSRMHAAHEKETRTILGAYKDDMAKLTRMYENNVDLVKHYEKLADDLSGIITLNTQVQTQLVEQIKHNMFCPIIREKGPQG
jgi:hypothetical protein